MDKNDVYGKVIHINLEAVVGRCSENFRKFHRKTPVLEPVFNQVADPQGCSLY